MIDGCNIDVIGDYVDYTTMTQFKCRSCNNTWENTPKNLVRNSGCPKCHRKNMDKSHSGMYRKKTHDEFICDLNKINPNIHTLSEYAGASKKIKCRCDICGNEWETTARNLLSGNGCKICGYKSSAEKQRYKKEKYDSILKQLNASFKIVGEYVNSKVPVLFRCDICGGEWYASIANVIKNGVIGTGCPRCKISHGEKYICEYLNANNIKYEQQKKFDELFGIGGRHLSYDFFIPSRNILIEYQGNYHDNTARIQRYDDYLKQSYHDSLKKEYAAKHNIKLIEIWYYDNLEQQLNECLT